MGRTSAPCRYTPSVEATVTVNTLNSSYVDGFGPDSVSMQLNTVLTNVDLFNTTGNQFWIQNVPVYVESTHKLYIVDNIWNFSNPAFDLTQNSFWSDRGFPSPRSSTTPRARRGRRDFRSPSTCTTMRRSSTTGRRCS